MLNQGLSLLRALRAVSAISLDTSNQGKHHLSKQFPQQSDTHLSRIASIRNAASQIVTNLFTYYSNGGANTPATAVGLFPYPPYYWWESGGVWGGMVDYWAYTKDTTWLSDTMNALYAQVGPAYDFVMPGQQFDTVRQTSLFLFKPIS